MSNLSPKRKSPTKARPSTAAFSPKKSVVVRGGDFSNIASINIIEELNGMEIVAQDKDIEIERLQTTCVTLNNKVSITDNL
jgi:hypothetical protein